MKWSSFFQYAGLGIMLLGIVIIVFDHRLPEDSFLLTLGEDSFLFFLGLGVWAMGEVMNNQQKKKAQKSNSPVE
jgi:hypothetical protein